MLKKIIEEIKNHKFVYFLLVFVLIGASFVRLHNTKEILGFYYDQGRDALVIWNLLHKGDLFLVGPTTGIEGILRGPWYYWLITPFYFLGGGNPVWPANFLAITSIFAIIVLYILGKEIFDRSTGIIAAAIVSFSYYIVVASRWLSNPTPMLLIGVLLILSMLIITKGKKWAWISLAILAGLSMQFGSATEAFYIPAILIFAFWQRKNLPSKKIILISLGSVFLIFLPQIIFDFMKDGILSDSIKKFLFEEESFKLSFWEVLKVRIPFYWNVFASKVWLGQSKLVLAFFILSISAIIFNFSDLWKKPGFKILLLLTFTPFIGMLFFQGNEGNVFDYYFTGYYFIFILFFSVGLGLLAKNKLGIIFVAYFLFLFFQIQIPIIQNYLINGRSSINLKEQVLAVDWVYEDSDKREFNVDVYVPPVIPHAYDYLFKWRGEKYGLQPFNLNVNLLYTLYEEDTFVRLDPWLERQKQIGKIEDEIIFRGITVQRRTRINK